MVLHFQEIEARPCSASKAKAREAPSRDSTIILAGPHFDTSLQPNKAQYIPGWEGIRGSASVQSLARLGRSTALASPWTRASKTWMDP